MDNDVIQTMSKAFLERGFGTLRFNFRGVGRSEGTFGGGEGELSDAAAALDWLQSSQYVAHRLWIAGFSFGAWIAMQLLMRRPELERFVITSPQIGMFDFNFLAPCPVSGMVISGGKDKTVQQSSVDSFVEKIRLQKGLQIDYTIVEDASHSFDGRLDQLNNVVQEYVKQTIGIRQMAS
jgi:alpha/beta superfamily hydrolase